MKIYQILEMTIVTDKADGLRKLLYIDDVVKYI